MRKVILGLVFILTFCSYTDTTEDTSIDTLASIITAECSVCDTYEQYLVGSTVLNRVDHWRWDDTVEKVVSDPNQFHGYCKEWYIPIARTERVARDLLKGKGRVYNIHYFYDPETSNQRLVKYWNKNLVYSGKFHNYASE